MNIVNKDSLSESDAPETLNKEAEAFIQQVTSLLAPWGFPPSSGRIYGYLLLHTTPVALDKIAKDLAMSKAGAWSAAKDMESFGHIRRYSEPGSKRALYAMSDNFALPMVKHAALLGEIGSTYRRGAEEQGEGEVASQLQLRADFFQAVQQAISSTIEEFLSRRS